MSLRSFEPENESFSAAFSALAPAVEHWRYLQTELHDVRRWRRVKRLRRQDVLQHTISFSHLVSMACRLIESTTGARLDEWLMLSAALQHDIGEGVLKDDVPAPHKTANHDAIEARASLQMLGTMDDWNGTVTDRLQDAYLLQYVNRPSWAGFDPAAIKKLEWLKANRSREAKIFPLLEIMDYQLYTIDEYWTKVLVNPSSYSSKARCQAAFMLAEVSAACNDRLWEATKNWHLAGLRSIWTEEVHDWLKRQSDNFRLNYGTKRGALPKHPPYKKYAQLNP